MLQQPAPVPLDALCAWHPEERAVALCERCGSFTCGDCFELDHQNRPLCRQCLQGRPMLAEVSQRFWANLVDAATFYTPLLVGGGRIAWLDMRTDVSWSTFVETATWVCVVELVLSGFQLYLCARFSQSLGKRMMNIQVVRSDGSPASLGRILLLRNLVPQLITMGCSLFTFVDPLFIFGRERRCLHDVIADTIVIKAESPTS